MPLNDERLIALGRVRDDPECRKFLPRRRRRQLPSESWLFRMARHGSIGVRLETVRVGQTLCTSPEALRRFFDALSRARDGAATKAKPDIAMGHAGAERELALAGI
jgi:hypothetical protein